MKTKKQIKNAVAVVLCIASPFIARAQEVTVNGGNVKVKAAGTAVETKNGNVNVKTSGAKKTSASSVSKTKNIVGNDLSQTISCNGEDVTIMGNDNEVTIIGYVKNIKVTGSDNTVAIDKVMSVKVIGSDNGISYKTSPNKNGMAMVSSVGSDNAISKR